MRTAIYILLVIVTVLILICYSLCVMAHDADERAERMYRKWIEANRELVDALKTDTICAQNLRTSKWKEQLEYDMQNNGEPIDSDYNIGIDHAVCVIEAMKGADDESV